MRFDAGKDVDRHDDMCGESCPCGRRLAACHCCFSPTRSESAEVGIAEVSVSTAAAGGCNVFGIEVASCDSIIMSSSAVTPVSSNVAERCGGNGQGTCCDANGRFDEYDMMQRSNPTEIKKTNRVCKALR